MGRGRGKALGINVLLRHGVRPSESLSQTEPELYIEMQIHSLSKDCFSHIMEAKEFHCSSPFSLGPLSAS